MAFHETWYRAFTLEATVVAYVQISYNLLQEENFPDIITEVLVAVLPKKK
jgi:hypothetical protein